MKWLFFILLTAASACLCAQFTYDNLNVDYAGAVQFRNLRLIPIRARASFFDTITNRGLTDLSQALTLQEAMATGQVRISERRLATVNTLMFENLSDRPVLILSGEIVRGGLQDRVVARDMILYPSEEPYRVPVFCVEEGRWHGKKEFSYYHEASMHLRRKVDLSGDQAAIWKEIREENAQDGVNSSTQAYTAHADQARYIQAENDYLNAFVLDAFSNPGDIVGVVGVTGSVVMGCDIFVSPEIFSREYNSIVFAYIDEALTFGLPVTISQNEVSQYLDQLLSNEVMQQRFLTRNGKIHRQNGKVYHITTYESLR